MIEQTDKRIVLHLGQPATGSDVVAATRDWISQMEVLLRRYPTDWAFMFDRRWSKLLATAAGTRTA